MTMNVAKSLKHTNPAEFPYAYLITVPAIHGHHNNPLGFFYLYDAERQLKAIIPELNTSFDERNMWLVEENAERRKAKEAGDSPRLFKAHFDKYLHVSVFNPSTEGSYTIESTDPVQTVNPALNILIILRSADGAPKMLGKIEATGPALDASSASIFAMLWFIVRWWWVALPSVTYGRILSEAGKIYMRGAQSYARPELSLKSLGKPARAVEV